MKKIFTFLPLVFAIQMLFALNQSQISIKRISAAYFNVDSNNPCGLGTRGAYVAFRITNVSTSPIQSVTTNLSNFTPSGFSLAGGQASNQYIGTLNPNQSKVVFWYIAYPCSYNTACNLFINVKDAVVGTVSNTFTFTTRSSISASSGGMVVAHNWGTGAVVGQVVPLDVTYSFGNGDNGDDYNMQPAGNMDFDAGTLQLINTEILTSMVPKIKVGSRDSMFYKGGATTGTNKLIKIRYYFEVKKASNMGVFARPYAVMGNSDGQYKYSGNYGTISLGLSPAAMGCPFVLKVNGSHESANPCDTVLYKVVVTNTSPYAASLDEIKAVLPADVSYIGIIPTSQVTESSMMSFPAQGDTGCVRWIGGKNATVYPYKTFYVPGNDSIILSFNVRVACNVPLNTPSSINAISYAGTDSSNKDQKGICLNCETIFPVELSYFEVKANDNYEAILQWQTLSEINNDHFEVEHSIDGKAFEQIGKIQGAGSSNQTNVYHFMHKKVLNGKNYYRLKQVDVDGKFSYSDIKSVNISPDIFIDGTFYPNPVSQRQPTTLQISTSKATKVRVEVRNLQGVLIQEIEEFVEVNKEVSLDTSNLSSGNYYVRLIPYRNMSIFYTTILRIE